MMFSLPVLSLVVFWPFLWSWLLLLFPSHENSNDYYAKVIKRFSFIVVLFTVIMSMILYGYMLYLPVSDYYFVDKYDFFESSLLSYHVGVDNLSMIFIIMTSIVFLIAVLYDITYLKHNVREYMFLILLLESLILLFFASLNLILFYISFELILLPIFFIILVWGGKNREYASMKFLLYSVSASMFGLLSVIYIVSYLEISYIPNVILSAGIIPSNIAQYLWLGLFISFAVKVPLWPMHTWLPDAHVSAPTSGSIILAAILLKVGGYAILRVLIPIFPEISAYFSGYVILLSSIAVIYASLAALGQQDIKRVIAYSSIAHMGFVVAGLFSFSDIGNQGAVFQMISHGFVSAALFFVVGLIYEYNKTRNIDELGNIYNDMPGLAFFFMLFTFASIGLPMTSGFVGEFLIVTSLVESARYYYAAVIVIGVVLSAVYMLQMYRKIMFGKFNLLSSNIPQELLDKSKSDNTPFVFSKNLLFAMYVLSFVILLLGIFPYLILHSI